MRKPVIITVTAIAIIIFLMSSTKTFAKATDTNKKRYCDPFGCGHFGADRGNRKHEGVDIVVVKGQDIFAPIGGKVTRFPFPYGSDLKYTGIEIINDKYKCKIFYLTPKVAIGTTVKAGDKIAIAQDISEKYGNSMTPHIHVEIYDVKTGKLLDYSQLV
jgi:murein DD-endopeptidase MepM/ murein hydrolase activator NlpD